MIESIALPGEPRQPWWRKINPVWWLFNDQEPTAPDWYLPGSSATWREIAWWLRNPAYNFFRYVVGIEDRPVTVTGPAPVLVTTAYEAWGTYGWKWARLRSRWFVFPFVSYESARWILYAGWLPSGGRFGVKVNYKTQSGAQWF